MVSDRREAHYFKNGGFVFSKYLCFKNAFLDAFARTSSNQVNLKIVWNRFRRLLTNYLHVLIFEFYFIMAIGSSIPKVSINMIWAITLLCFFENVKSSPASTYEFSNPHFLHRTASIGTTWASWRSSLYEIPQSWTGSPTDSPFASRTTSTAVASSKFDFFSNSSFCSKLFVLQTSSRIQF